MVFKVKAAFISICNSKSIFLSLDKPTNMCKSAIKKQSGDQSCSSNRKNMKFVEAAKG